MSKKKTQATSSEHLETIKVGSRVRFIEDGTEGKITWANSVAVKIRWDDGELVTWKRADLALKGIKVLDAADETPPTAPAATAEPPVPEQGPPAEPVVEPAPATPDQDPSETSAAEPGADPEAPATTEPVAEQPPSSPEPTTATETSVAEPAPALEQTETEAPAPDTSTATSDAGQPKKARKATAATEPKQKKLSALDAAAKVLAEAGQAMNAQEMIQAMADKGYWTSPGGKTPAATIYAAIISEIKNKGADARFVKTERGKFARKA